MRVRVRTRSRRRGARRVPATRRAARATASCPRARARARASNTGTRRSQSNVLVMNAALQRVHNVLITNAAFQRVHFEVAVLVNKIWTHTCVGSVSALPLAPPLPLALSSKSSTSERTRVGASSAPTRSAANVRVHTIEIWRTGIILHRVYGYLQRIVVIGAFLRVRQR